MLNSDLFRLKITTEQLNNEQVKMEYGTKQVASKLKLKIFFVKLFYSHCMCCSISLAHHLENLPM